MKTLRGALLALPFRPTIRSRSNTTMSRIPGKTDTTGPALEFNLGALPNTHLYGVGDMELGIKYRL